jgi:hypothetical protein
MWEHTKSTDDPTIAATAIRFLAERWSPGDPVPGRYWDTARWAVLAIVGAPQEREIYVR